MRRRRPSGQSPASGPVWRRHCARGRRQATTPGARTARGHRKGTLGGASTPRSCPGAHPPAPQHATAESGPSFAVHPERLQTSGVTARAGLHDRPGTAGRGNWNGSSIGTLVRCVAGQFGMGDGGHRDITLPSEDRDGRTLCHEWLACGRGTGLQEPRRGCVLKGRGPLPAM